MKSLLVLLALGVPAIGLARASAPADERLTELRRDLEMIEAFVEGGLRLAREDDPLKRAQACNEMAEKVAREIKASTGKKEVTRVVALGERLQTILIRGVGDNLELARKEEIEAARKKEIVTVGGRVEEWTKPLQASMRKAFETLDEKSAKEFAPAMEGLSRAREDVESVVTGKKRPKEKGKGKAKGKKS